ncbi:alpha/beta fold hydrolase [Nocardia seriolae]|uniref:alpha/beta fold hydrolase n=1 Tax=Nocardia seriolae TaxID=37332 RepID=UPI001E37FF85|nr:alpha/beta fold hydrolase [Nocardia seriolae]
MEPPQQTPGERAHDGRARWRTVVVDGIRSRYLVGGAGPSVVLLHGFGLANRTYRPALDELARRGLRVYAPTMPGFGGTGELPRRRSSISGYAAWVAAFIRAVGIDEPVTLIGHSFGGGVAIMTAYDRPDLVGRLVLVNSVGGSAWVNGRGTLVAMTQRPLWDWGLHLQADVLPVPELTRVLPVVLRDGVPAALTHPRAFWRGQTRQNRQPHRRTRRTRPPRTADHGRLEQRRQRDPRRRDPHAAHRARGDPDDHRRGQTLLAARRSDPLR